ncbi:hypothetical protein GCM10009840_07670 [Pseudolysinimonas kribbensis]|uniref:hypothetical protein n=1 Tax=Pseudolysinimonas kribbensis TaxID=433641 RepID=UPI0031DBB5CF
MALSRKRQKELKRLRRSAEDLWQEQREAIDHASTVLREARRQAGNYAREEVGPRVRSAYDDRIRPAVASARHGISHDMLPAVSGAVGSALAVLEATRDPRVRDVVRKAASVTDRIGKVTPLPVKKKTPVGRYIALGIGAVAVAGVLYAAWQTLRADDDLWIEDLGEVGAADIGEDD